MKPFLAASTTAIVLASILNVTASAAASEKHLFYLHGAGVKDSNDPKVKIYETIVQELTKSGFTVDYELRTSDIGDSVSGSQEHAKKLAGQIQDLLAKNTPPENITVAGFSLGAMTALVASGLVNNPKINFVLLSGCPVKPTIPVPIDYTKVKGRVLSIINANDQYFGSCNGKFREGVTFKEIVLNSGEGHSVFRMPEEQYLKLWKEPLVEWANRN